MTFFFTPSGFVYNMQFVFYNNTIPSGLKNKMSDLGSTIKSIQK